MDDGEDIGSSKFDGALLLHLPEKESVGSPDDVLARRLKNRERQRRYRARKRHEADLKKASLTARSTPMSYGHMPPEFVSVPVEIEVSQNLTLPEYLTRVYCQRDWKKDARRAHLLKNQEAVHVSTNSGTAASVGGALVPLLESCVGSNYSDSVVDSSATHRLQSNRRHWKTEARNKKG